jgi:drug/metabolite transporter (DMT)-like permease
MKKNNLLISLLLIIISLIWAGSFIAVKITVDGDKISGIDLGFLRFLVATPFMVLILLLKKGNILIPFKEFPSLVILGLTGVSLLYIFQFTGIELTNASTSAVLINTNVIFIVILSIAFLKEKLSIKKGIGIILSFSGVIIVVFAQSINEQIEFTDMFLTGSIFVIFSAFCWAVYSIVGKKLIKKYDEFTVTTYAFVLGTIFYLPIVLPSISQTMQNTSFNGWIAVFYLALLCSVFGYIGWYYALKKTEASKTAIYLNLIPLFAIIMSFFLGENPTILFILGAILIIYGIYLTQKS